MIYVASPFSHDDPKVRRVRATVAKLYTEELIKSGRMAFSPITYGSIFDLPYNPVEDWKVWKPLNDRALAACDQVHVLQLAGWKSSIGMAYEIEIAMVLEKPLLYISADRLTTITEKAHALVQHG